jgi:hypothetical protein
MATAAPKADFKFWLLGQTIPAKYDHSFNDFVKSIDNWTAKINPQHSSLQIPPGEAGYWYYETQPCRPRREVRFDDEEGYKRFLNNLRSGTVELKDQSDCDGVPVVRVEKMGWADIESPSGSPTVAAPASLPATQEELPVPQKRTLSLEAEVPLKYRKITGGTKSHSSTSSTQQVGSVSESEPSPVKSQRQKRPTIKVKETEKIESELAKARKATQTNKQACQTQKAAHAEFLKKLRSREK